MIKINLKPSFHKYSSITLNQDEVEYEILPTLLDLKGLDKKEKLLTSEYLELKKIKSFNEIAKEEYFAEKNTIPNTVRSEILAIEKLLNQIIEKPTIDERMMLDGINIECILSHSNSESKRIEFRSPERDTRELEIMKSLFVIMNDTFLQEPVLNHIELMQGYFRIGNQWKITSENPLTLRLFGSLSIYEKEEITALFNTLKANELLLLDIRNLDGMGATFHESFSKLIHKMKAVYWLISDREDELLNYHFDQMEIPKDSIFINKEEIVEKMKKLKI